MIDLGRQERMTREEALAIPHDEHIEVPDHDPPLFVSGFSVTDGRIARDDDYEYHKSVMAAVHFADSLDCVGWILFRPWGGYWSSMEASYHDGSSGSIVQAAKGEYHYKKKRRKL